MFVGVLIIHKKVSAAKLNSYPPGNAFKVTLAVSIGNNPKNKKNTYDIIMAKVDAKVLFIKFSFLENHFQ